MLEMEVEEKKDSEERGKRERKREELERENELPWTSFIFFLLFKS
jgi:hypothetical protein